MLVNGRTAHECPPSQRIVDAIAAHIDVDPRDLSVPLYDVVDLEAVDSVLSSAADTGGSMRVHFVYCGLEVVVDVDGRIRVTPGA
jgi:hypothetical protein